MKRINDSLIFSAPSYSQRAALYALEKRHVYAKQIVPEFEKRMSYGAQRIRAIPGFTLSPAAGGIYLFPGIKKTGLTSLEACAQILEQARQDCEKRRQRAEDRLDQAVQLIVEKVVSR